MYDPEERKVLISRDVVFVESKSWDWDNASAYRDKQLEIQAQFKIGDDNTGFTEETGTGAQSSILSQTSEDNSDGPDTHSTGESDASSVSRQYKSLTDIYENTEEVELDEELLFLGIEEPATYN